MRNKEKIFIFPSFLRENTLKAWADQVIIMDTPCVFMSLDLNQRLQWLRNSISYNICLINFYGLIKYPMSYSTLASTIDKYKGIYIRTHESTWYILDVWCLGLCELWVNLFEKSSLSEMVCASLVQTQSHLRRNLSWGNVCIKLTCR